LNAPRDAQRHIHFITGKLAEHALRATVVPLADKLGFQFTIGVMPITVAALMTPRWLARHFVVPEQATEVMLPGYLGEELDPLQQMTSAKVVLGPKDLRDIASHLTGAQRVRPDLTEHNVEIIAEINHAPRLDLLRLLNLADELRNEGADRIDIGCNPGERWSQVGTAIAELCRAGHSVSIDSFDSVEVAQACDAGASLVLSVNSSNVREASRWGAEVVAIPDTPENLASLDATVEQLNEAQVPFRIDPILEPIGFGFFDSLLRYHVTRQRYPEAKMMMGIGNLTELSDVDSAGVNFLLLGICAELKIESVLTTQVIPWAQSSVRECEIARRILHYAVKQRVPPKRLDDQLVVLRDSQIKTYPRETISQLSSSIRDNNYRIFAQDGLLQLVSAGLYLADKDPFLLFERLLQEPIAENIEQTHAFYLGYEFAKAQIALLLGKQYEQDQALNWGHLTVAEPTHRLKHGPGRPRKRS
jgi:dihydropteroate synthase-like protein